MPLLIESLCVLACRVLLAFKYRPKTQYLRVLCIIQSVIGGPNVAFSLSLQSFYRKSVYTNQPVM